MKQKLKERQSQKEKRQVEGPLGGRQGSHGSSRHVGVLWVRGVGGWAWRAPSGPARVSSAVHPGRGKPGPQSSVDSARHSLCGRADSGRRLSVAWH